MKSNFKNTKTGCNGWASEWSKMISPHQLQHQGMIGNRNTSLTIVNFDILRSSEPAQKHVSQLLPPEKSIVNADEWRDNISPSSIKNSTAHPVAEADVPIRYAN